MKSNMKVDVEFLAGTEITQAVEEAKQKAEMWGVAYVCFDFNGTRFSIGKGADVGAVLKEWNDGAPLRRGICAA